MSAVRRLLAAGEEPLVAAPDSVYMLARGRLLSNHFCSLRFQRLKISHGRHMCLGRCLCYTYIAKVVNCYMSRIHNS